MIIVNLITNILSKKKKMNKNFFSSKQVLILDVTSDRQRQTIHI